MTEAGGRRLLNATAVMASGTMVSRVLGVIRAMLIAFALGNGTLRAEVFTFAMTVPNSLYMLLAGGTLNNVLVPQIVRAVLHDEDEGKAFVDRIMTGFLIILGTLTVLLTLAVPWVMSIYMSPTWRADNMADQWQSLLLMSYLTMPQLFFYGVFFLIGQVLNARDSFGPMMWAPIANNVVSIAVFGAYIAIWGGNAVSGTAFTPQQTWLLGAGSTLGIAIQTVVLLPYLRRVGFRFRPRFDLKGTGLGRTFHVAKWMVGYVALTSLAQVVVTNLASTATPIDPVTQVAMAGAGLNAYQNAYLIWILPHSLLTVSLATAMLPAASRAAAAGDTSGVTTETTRALRLATTFLLPSSLGFIVLADPIARLIFGHGQGAQDYHFVAWTLMAFAIGLVPYTIQYLYLRAFYALDNTKVPFLLQIGISGANALLAVALVLPFENPATVAPRLALAYALAYWIGVAITHHALAKRLPALPGRETVQHLTRLFLAALPAAAAAWLVTAGFASFSSLALQATGLVAAAGLAVLVFFFAAKRMGIPEATELIGVLRRRSAPTSDEAAGQQVVEELLEAEAAAHPGPGVEALNHDPDGVGVFVQVGAPAAVSHPPETALNFPSPSIQSPAAGRVLGGRYRMDELLAERGGHETWLANDVVLARPVLIHLLAPGDSRGAQVQQLARRAALATDSRFLRVLDVVDAVPGEHGVYLVYEYASGRSLQQVLADGPLSGAETAWVVREISDALIEVHAHGIYHRHLNPGSVLVTASGNIKIIGLLVDAALASEPAEHRNGEAEDVHALGKLLYACLVTRWPGGDRFGLLAAPVDNGRLLLPSQVRNGVAQPVDAVVDRILSPQPRHQASRLVTAAEVTTELSLVLGPSSAAADLRLRLDHTLPGTATGPTGPVSVVAPPVPTPARPRFEVETRLPHPAREEISGELTEALLAEALDTPVPFTPVPPPPASAVPALTAGGASASGASSSDAAGKNRRPWIVIGLGLLLAIAAILALINIFSGSTPGAAPAAGPVPVTRIADFDPKADGGSGAENSKLAKRAIDSKPDTAWTTERYRTLAALGGLKPGVGLLLDLGDPRRVTGVSLTLEGAPTSVEIRVPVTATDTAPMRSVSQWRRLAATDDGKGTFTLDFPAEQTQFVLVYLTSLPAVGDGYFRGAVAEVSVIG
ncbi:MAG: murein biosynthesis integral membrane protein MurJ [Propionicimonas sp.]